MYHLHSSVSIFLLLAAFFGESQGQNCTYWSYENLGPGTLTGTANWPQTCSTCSGTQQSPIDLNMNITSLPPANQPSFYYDVQLTPNASWYSVNFTLLNTGDSVRLLFNNLNIQVTGLGLPGTFIAAQMHWHWGSETSGGSEHTFSGSHYAMEGHLVSYNSIYPSFLSALGQPNGIAVIGVWYNNSAANDNQYFSAITNGLTNIPFATETTNIPGFNVYDLLPISTLPYFRYNGSLTTPNCQQGVIWTVVNNPFYISANQMNIMQNSLFFAPFLNSSNTTMVDNYRPTQPLNGRTVYYVPSIPPAQLASSPVTGQSSANSVNSPLVPLLITISLAFPSLWKFLQRNVRRLV